MVDTSHIDPVAFYSRYVQIAGKPKRVNGEIQWNGSCPWCQGSTDRFMFSETGRYSCAIRSSGCGRHGPDVIAFLREYEGISFKEACSRLGIELTGEKYANPGISEGSRKVIERLKQKKKYGGTMPPSEDWQKQARARLELCQKFLWGEVGKHALQYLRERGLSDQTIKDAQLGYIPLKKDGRWYCDPSEKWGLKSDQCQKVWLPEGILIPWQGDGHIWRLNVRRLTGLREGSPKYIQIPTNGGDGLYNVDQVALDQPIVLVESELDALSGQQEAGDLAVFLATGGTSRGRNERWLARLSKAKCVLIAFDDDEDKHGVRPGDRAAKQLEQLIPHAIRWLPWSHDINDMLKAGQSIRAWIKTGIQAYDLISSPSLTKLSEPAQEDATDELPRNCCICWESLDASGLDFNFSPDGKQLYCERHTPQWLTQYLNKIRQLNAPSTIKEDAYEKGKATA